jgi:hypothetical protein
VGELGAPYPALVGDEIVLVVADRRIIPRPHPSEVLFEYLDVDGVEVCVVVNGDVAREVEVLAPYGWRAILISGAEQPRLYPL